jgi:hypothetical protein
MPYLRQSARALIPALLITAASGCNNAPAPQSSSSPPVVDLTCPAEPDVAAMLAFDPSGLAFDVAVRTAGQQCRDALHRVCQWHKDRGLKDVDCDKPQAMVR